MGLNVTWVVAKGVGKDAVLEALGMVETGAFEGKAVAEAAVAELPNGWTVVHFGRFNRLTHEQAAATFPRSEVVWGTSSESVMWSGSYGLRNGHRAWSVEHDPEKDLDGLACSGEVPPELHEIHEDLRRQRQDDEEGGVDFVFEAPMALTAALTGYDPTRQYEGVHFRTVEPRQSGRDGERQAADIALCRRLSEAIEAELIPKAAALGFRPADQVPDNPFKADSPFGLVRLRDGLSETIEFAPHVEPALARIAIGFFVRRGFEARSGGYGVAVRPKPKRTIAELFTGRKAKPADEAFAEAVQGARELLHAVDRHLKEGAAHPHIRPASYYDGPVA